MAISPVAFTIEDYPHRHIVLGPVLRQRISIVEVGFRKIDGSRQFIPRFRIVSPQGDAILTIRGAPFKRITNGGIKDIQGLSIDGNRTRADVCWSIFFSTVAITVTVFAAARGQRCGHCHQHDRHHPKVFLHHSLLFFMVNWFKFRKLNLKGIYGEFMGELSGIYGDSWLWMTSAKVGIFRRNSKKNRNFSGGRRGTVLWLCDFVTLWQ